MTLTDKRARFWALALLVLGLAGFLRMMDPLADLPADLSISGSIYTDEGNQCHNSRSRVLHGDWFPDDWRITHYNPILPGIKYVIFRIWGTGLLQIRMVSQVFALLGILMLMLFLKDSLGPGEALLGGLLAATSALWNFYSRIGTFEIPMLFWMLLCLALLARHQRRPHPLLLAGAGASAFLAFIFKNIAVYFIPVPAAALVLMAFSRHRPPGFSLLRDLAWMLLGLILAGGSWYLFFYLPAREWIASAPGSFIGNQLLPTSLSQAWHNLLGFNWREQFPRFAPVWIAGLLYLPFYTRRLLHREHQMGETTAVLALVAHTSFFMVMNHRPTRYLLPALPFLLILSLFRLSGKKLRSSRPWSRPLKVLRTLLDLPVLLLISTFAIVPLLSRWGFFPAHPGWGSLLLAWLALVLAHRFFRGFCPPPTLRRLTLVLFLATAVGLDAFYLASFWKQRSHKVVNLSRELARKLPEDAWISGLTAPVAVMEGKQRALFLYPGFVNWDHPYQRYPLTHALLATFNQEVNLHFNAFPTVMEQSRLLGAWTVKEQFLLLYQMNGPKCLLLKQTAEGSSAPVLATLARPLKTAPEGNGPWYWYRWVPTGQWHRERAFLPADLPPVPTPITLPPPSGPGDWVLSTPIPQWQNPLRLEAEGFASRIGHNIAERGASRGWIRRFDPRLQKSEALVLGPHAPFNPGLMVVRLRLRAPLSWRRIGDLAVFRISDSHQGTLLKEQVIHPSDLNPRGEWTTILVPLPLGETRSLDFRLLPRQREPIDMDWLELDIREGALLHMAPQPDQTLSACAGPGAGAPAGHSVVQ